MLWELSYNSVKQPRENRRTLVQCVHLRNETVRAARTLREYPVRCTLAEQCFSYSLRRISPNAHDNYYSKGMSILRILRGPQLPGWRWNRKICQATDLAQKIQSVRPDPFSVLREEEEKRRKMIGTLWPQGADRQNPCFHCLLRRVKKIYEDARRRLQPCNVASASIDTVYIDVYPKPGFEV